MTPDLDCAAAALPSDALGLARSVRTGTITARAAVVAALARIQRLNPALNAVTEVFATEALAAADALDARPGESLGALAGVPILAKCDFDIEGTVTTLGGYGNSTPAPADSEVIRRLRAADAIILGRTAAPEFGQFPTTESERTGVTRNPWDLTRGPGGSSGGSAAAVAAGMVPIALGSDGGGSLRIPAGTCGLIGLKPTRGLVSTAPLREHWYSLVLLGGITRTPADSALLLDVITGNTSTDRWRWEPPLRSFREQVQAGPGELSIAWTNQSVAPWIRTDPEVIIALDRVAAALAGLGHRLSQWRARFPVPIPAFLPQFFAGLRAEGQQVEHPERLEPRTSGSIKLSGWANPRVVEWAIRRGEQDAVRLDETVFAEHDLLVLPTMPVLTAPAAQLQGLGSLRSLIRTTPQVSNTALFNVTGHPALSVPGGWSIQGWPIGVQLVARRGSDGLLLAVASQLAQLSPPPTAPLHRLTSAHS